MSQIAGLLGYDPTIWRIFVMKFHRVIVSVHFNDKLKGGSKFEWEVKDKTPLI